MPEWLIENENYTPNADKDTFINKSILSLLKVVSSVRAQGIKSGDRFGVDAFFRVLFTLALVIMVSMSHTTGFVYIALAYILVLLCLLPSQDIIKTLRISLVAALFTLVIMLPAYIYGSGARVLLLPLKVLVTVMAVSILSRTTRWDLIIGALKRFYVPDLIVFVLDITLKYIVMLGEFCVEMLCSLRLRSVGKNKSKYTAISGVAGTMFLKSREMAEDMYLAMECRGFTGGYRAVSKFSFKIYDLAYIIINAVLIYLFIYLYRG
jgi:ABC-type cobalt transport system, permease component CbiQ and related transporters